MQQDSLFKKGIWLSVIHPSTRISRYVFLASNECHGIYFHALRSHWRQVSHTKPVWRDVFFFVVVLFYFKSFKKHVIVLKVSLNDPDWPHFSAWPTMATLKLPFLLLYFARLVRTSHIFSQANQCPSEKYFSILIKTTQTFTSARGFYQVWRGKH